MSKRLPDFGPPLPSRENLTSLVIMRLTEQIQSGALAPGDRLPTETDLVKAFGVSRTVIREAFASLRSSGLIVTYQGRGAFVSEQATISNFQISPDELVSLEDVLHVMELRLSVEVEMTGLAAKNRTKVNLKEIARTRDAFYKVITRDDTAVREDMQFHMSIARSTQNPYFEKFIAFLSETLIPRQRIRYEMDDDAARRSYLERVHTEHVAIFDAISAGDPDLARERARYHLEHSQDRYRKLMRNPV